MTNAMKTLYMKLEKDCNDSPKTSNAFNVLCEKNNLEESNKKNHVLSEVISEERETAFNAGFRIAVQLLVGGGLS